MLLDDAMNIKLAYKKPLFAYTRTFFFNKKCLSRVSLIRWFHFFYYFDIIFSLNHSFNPNTQANRLFIKLFYIVLVLSRLGGREGLWAVSKFTSPSEVYPAGKLQWHFNCGFNFRHSLWLPFETAFAVLKGLML